MDGSPSEGCDSLVTKQVGAAVALGPTSLITGPFDCSGHQVQAPSILS